jgi:hypothetical protein
MPATKALCQARRNVPHRDFPSLLENQSLVHPEAMVIQNGKMFAKSALHGLVIATEVAAGAACDAGQPRSSLTLKILLLARSKAAG